MIELIEAQQVILDKDFGQDANCIPEYPTEWTRADLTIINSCSVDCVKQASPSEAVALISEYTAHPRFTFTYTSLVPHSVVIVQGLLVITSQTKVTVWVNSSLKVIIKSPFRDAAYSDNYDVLCSADTVKLKRIYTIHRTPLTGNQLKLDVQTSAGGRIFGLKHVKVTISCGINCEKCLSDISCSKCLAGFRMVEITTGVKVCEEMMQCPNYCPTCVYDNSSLKCLTCIGGYTLNASYQCIANTIVTPCLTGQYTDKLGNCKDYSIQCAHFDSNLKTNVPCSAGETVIQYSCPKGTFALIYFLDDLYQAKCECTDQDCEECSSLTSCDTCKTGFSVRLYDGQCVKPCNTGEYYNKDTKTCITCTGTNCLECVAQTCTLCSNNSMYLDPSNLQNCIACTVQKCDKCFDQGKCQQCQSPYILSTDKQTCCGVSNCLQCQTNNPDKCTTCKTGFITDSNNISCLCTATNCQQCDNNDGSKCTACNDGYVLNSLTKICECLSPNCLKCKNDDSNKCSACQTNYNLLSEQCVCAIQNCQTCNSLNSNLCDSCKTGFVADSNKTQCLCSAQNCQQCDLINGSKCSVCNDGFVLNIITKICECLSSNCTKCKINDANKCSNCKNGFQLENEQCVCPNSNCQICDSINTTVCTQCKSGFTLTDPQTCCGISNCEECVSGNSNQCNKCKSSTESISYTLSDDKTKCDVKYNSLGDNDFSLSHSLNLNYYDIKILFEKAIILLPNKSDISQYLTIDVSNIDPSKYSLEIKLISLLEVQVLITPQLNMKNSEVTVLISDESFFNINKFQQKSKQQQLKPFVKLSQNLVTTNDDFARIINQISKGLSYAVIPVSVFGNLFIVSNTLDIAGFLYYLNYLDIRYPDNVSSFYQVFKNLKLSFIPNIFENAVSSDYTQDSPPKFMELETGNYFIKNAGQSITVCLIGVGVYFIAKLLSFAQLPLISKYLKTSMKETWEFGALMSILWSFYIYIVVGIFMQFNTYNFDDNSAGFNYALHSIITIAALALPFYLWYKIFSTKNLINDTDLKQKFSHPLDGIKLYQHEIIQFKFKNENRFIKLSKYTSIVLYFRKIIFCLVIAYAYSNVYFQLSFFCAMNAAVILFIIIVNPFEERQVQVRYIIQECILISVQICAFTLVKDSNDQDETDRINVGWGIITLGTFFIGWMTLIILKNLIVSVGKLFFKNQSLSIKVVPVNLQIESKDSSPVLPKFTRFRKDIRSSTQTKNNSIINIYSTNVALSTLNRESTRQNDQTARRLQES